jgi:hypothetical protein
MRIYIMLTQLHGTNLSQPLIPKTQTYLLALLSHVALKEQNFDE